MNERRGEVAYAGVRPVCEPVNERQGEAAYAGAGPVCERGGTNHDCFAFSSAKLMRW
jgi:hypothetical protein